MRCIALVPIALLLTGCSDPSENSPRASGANWWEVKSIRKKCPTAVKVSGPTWERSGVNAHGLKLNFSKLRNQQIIYLAKFRAAALSKAWGHINDDHFDWWMFPCDFGSKEEYVIRSESEIAQLLADAAWLANYRESVRIVSRALGWDIEKRLIITDGSGGGWRSDKDIRLAKIIRSLWLLGQAEYMLSLQEFARFIQTRLYNGGSFWYTHCLDDMLLLKLPRPIPYKE